MSGMPYKIISIVTRKLESLNHFHYYLCRKLKGGGMEIFVKKIFLKSRLALNMLFSGIVKPLSMILSYIYIPIALDFLGIEKYGIWSTILTILSWISYFDVGVGNGLRNKLTQSLSREDGQGRKLVSSAYAFISAIMISVAAIFSIIAMFIDWKRVFGVSDIDENLTGVVIISVIFVAISFVLSICNNALYAMQKAAVVSFAGLIIQALNLIGILFLSNFFNGNLYVMALVYGLSTISVYILENILVYYKNREIRPSFKSVDINVGKNLTNLGLQFFVIQICALILFTTDSLIISFLYGAADVTPYNMVNKLYNVIIGIFSALLVPIWNAVVKANIEKRYVTIKKTIINLYLLMIPFLILTIILTIIFIPLSNWWLGQKLDYGNYLIVFGAMYCIISIWTNTHGIIANGLEILKEQMTMSIIQAVINIPVSIYLAKIVNLGVAGILLGTNISLLISSIWLPILIFKQLKQKMGQ